jgi:hypothetical protein
MGIEVQALLLRPADERLVQGVGAGLFREDIDQSHWSSSCVPADAGRAPRRLARAQDQHETSACRLPVEVP